MKFDDSNDPDKNFYENIQAVDMQHYFPSELLSLSENRHMNLENFSMIHLKTFGKLKDFLPQAGSF